MTAAVHIVKFGFSHTIVHIDGWEEKLTFLRHLLEAEHTCSSLLAHTLALLCHPGVLCLVYLDRVLQQLQDAFELGIVRARWIWQSSVLGKPNSKPLWIKSVASPPSSTSWSQPSSPGTVIICSVHHQYSGRVSPFHAKTVDVPALAMAAAAWSCVLKMLQEHQRTLAPPM